MFKLKCSLALHCHSLGMVVIALCHTSSSNAGADVLQQLDDDGRMFVVRNWDVTSLGAAEVAQREVSFFNLPIVKQARNLRRCALKAGKTSTP